MFEFPLFCPSVGAVALDSPKGNVPVSSVSLIPPPPPPKNAARMLALALAESAQQATILSQRQSSGPPTPVSPVKPQELLETMDWPLPSLPSQPSLEETAVEASKRSTPTSSPPFTPTEKLTRSVSLHLNTAESGKSSSISCNSQDVISLETSSQSAMPSSQHFQVSQTQKSPERQQPAVGQTPVSTDKTTSTITTPSISSKDTVVQQTSYKVSSDTCRNVSSTSTSVPRLNVK